MKVIEAINSPKQSKTQWGHIIEDIKKASLCLQAYTFCHVSRGGNSLAHSLARRAVLTADTDVRLEELPQDLDDVFQSDLP